MSLPGSNQVNSDQDHTAIHNITQSCMTTRIFHFVEQVVLSVTASCSCRKSVRYVTHPRLKYDAGTFGWRSRSATIILSGRTTSCLKYTIGVTLIPTLDIVISTIKVKAKFTLQQSMKTQSASRGTALFYVTSALAGIGGHRNAPAALPPGETQYPFYRKLGGSQNRNGQVQKMSPPPAFDPQTVQPVASRYTDCAIPASVISISNLLLLLLLLLLLVVVVFHAQFYREESG